MQPSAACDVLGDMRFFILVYFFFHIALKYVTCIIRVHQFLNNVTYHISRTIRRTLIFSFDFLEKNNDECILILLIYWKKTGLVHTKISSHNLIYSS